jgi:hypothetical protein
MYNKKIRRSCPSPLLAYLKKKKVTNPAVSTFSIPPASTETEKKKIVAEDCLWLKRMKNEKKKLTKQKWGV